ncbi:universal stress protein [Silvanigrella aquatica]|uniref:UspA domain-containing protein n=1 Tax=Silvanigrella aquatica TaxID=1915309 RepID=A0A1L4D361_9BACT|nr:universal stress protein [Silvanigrella aquatica]APJ04627.1 hypothetical protein AXG55_12225 [Silvanigrella aquatica]
MQMIKKILCVTDLSLISRNAEIAALRLTDLFKAEMTVLSCGEYYAHVPNNYFDENIIQPQPDFPHTEEYLKFVEQKKLETIDHFNNISKIFNLKLPENIIYEIKLENEVTAAIDVIEEKNYSYDLIVVVKQNNNFWEKLLFGSPAIEICEESHISTLLMPESEEWASWMPKGIIVGSSLTEESKLAEIFASEFALKTNCEISILHIIDTVNLHFDMNVSHIFPIDYVPSQVQTQTIDEIKVQRINELNKIKDKLKEDFNLKNIHNHMDLGRVGDEILKYIKKYQQNNLLVIGASGGSALKRFFLGSKTIAIEEACSIPLLIAQKISS